MAELLDRLRNAGIRGKRNSSNEYIGRCPFHDGKHDTFAVNLTTGMYFCFSAKCHAKGHVSKLVGQIEKEYNFSDTFDDWQVKEEKEYLPDPSELDEWDLIHPYMLHRGFDRSFLMRNRIGYCRNERSITIPVFLEGVYYGCIKRTVVPDVQPKYTYPKGFPKKDLIYVPNYANHSDSNDMGCVVAVEGSINALKGAQHGFDTAAMLGCSPNEQQVYKLLRYARDNGKRVCWLFDNDESGKDGVDRLLREYFWLDCDVASIESLKYVDNGRDLCYTVKDTNGRDVPKNDVDQLSRKELEYVVSQKQDRFEYEQEKS